MLISDTSIKETLSTSHMKFSSWDKGEAFKKLWYYSSKYKKKT